MLKITRQSGADHDTLLLEGSLVKEWIEELREVLARTRHDRGAVLVDLSGLRFVDEDGARLLRACRRSGASLLGASPFVSAVLDPPASRRRRPRA
jgi:anti-anti-sigma regulatory factor